jgi:hypothetical protein
VSSLPDGSPKIERRAAGPRPHAGANLVQVLVSAADGGPEADCIESDPFKAGMSIGCSGNVAG